MGFESPTSDARRIGGCVTTLTDDVAERLGRGTVDVFRMHGSAKNMRKRPWFMMTLRGLAFRWDVTKEHVETILGYMVRGGLLERRIDETYPRERWAGGEWRMKAVLYRFTERVGLLLANVHDQAASQSKSAKYSRGRLSILGFKASVLAFVRSLRKEKETVLVHVAELRMPAHEPPSPIVCTGVLMMPYPAIVRLTVAEGINIDIKLSAAALNGPVRAEPKRKSLLHTLKARAGWTARVEQPRDDIRKYPEFASVADRR